MEQKQIEQFVQEKEWVFLAEGFDHWVYTDKDKIKVYRFPKDKEIARFLETEATVLTALQKRKLPMQFLVPKLKEEKGISYAIYPFVQGVHYPALPVDQKHAYLRRIGEALSALHRTRKTKVFDILPVIDYQQKFKKVFEALKKHGAAGLDKEDFAYAKQLMIRYFSSAEYDISKTTLMHADVSFDHIYHDAEGMTLIDWSDMHIGDPAYEFHHLLRRLPSEEIIVLMNAYNSNDPHFWQRAGMYTFLHTIDVFLIMLKQGSEEKIAFWRDRLGEDRRNVEAII